MLKSNPGGSKLISGYTLGSVSIIRLYNWDSDQTLMKTHISIYRDPDPEDVKDPGKLLGSTNAKN